MESPREARRRKILERGSDRLAFITGQVTDLPDSSSLPATPTKVEDPQNSVLPFSEGDATSSHFFKQYGSNKDAHSIIGERAESDRSIGIPRSRTSDQILDNKKEDAIGICESGNEAEVKALQTDRDSKLQSSSVAERSSDQVVDSVESSARVKKPQIGHAVSISENTRLLCAVTISLLVVLSSHGYALGGAVVGSIINFGPLFLVMFTDMTIILGLLMAMQGTHKTEKGRVRRRREEEHDGWAGNIGDALETLLVFQNVARAVFMDCTICAVIMISGLCI